MKVILKGALISMALLLSACANNVKSTSSTENTYEADKALIWELEQTIYERRAVGDIQFYLDNSNSNYLGWPFGQEVPISLDGLRDYASKDLFKPGEKIDVTLDGLTVEGDTAVAYFSTHRTRRPGGEAANDKFQNIHVWTRVDDKWTLIGSFSRKIQ